jgi:hypothetical protein
MVQETQKDTKRRRRGVDQEWLFLRPLEQRGPIGSPAGGGTLMPLVDHFHPPISRTHSWESFHSRWAGTLADLLNEQLPDPRYLVEVQVAVTSRIEADVIEWKLDELEPQGNGVVGVAVEAYTAPAAVRSLDFTFPDDIEVRIHDCREGKTLVAVIELVSPSNKDRPLDQSGPVAVHCKQSAVRTTFWSYRLLRGAYRPPCPAPCRGRPCSESRPWHRPRRWPG